MWLYSFQFKRIESRGHILHEERPGHRVSSSVCMMEECVEEWKKRVTKVQCTPHGCLGLLPKYIGLLRLQDTDTQKHTDNEDI